MRTRTTKERSRAALFAVLLGASALAAGGVAYAQTGVTYDPAQLPATKGRVAQYSLTPRGDVDGLILDDGTEVHLPPHLGMQLVFVAKPGDAVTVRGLRAREVPLVQAMQVTNDASGQSVTDAGPAGGPGGPGGRHGPGRRGGPSYGPPGERGPRSPEAGGQPMEAQGRIKAQLHGPRGDLNGVLLEDGTQVRLPPPEATRLAATLAVGQTLFVRGDGMTSSLGKLVRARELGASQAQLQTVQGPAPHGLGGPFGPGRDRRGPPPPPPGDAAPPPPPGGPGGPPPPRP